MGLRPIIPGSTLLGVNGMPEAMGALAQKIAVAPSRPVLSALAKTTALAEHALFRSWFGTAAADAVAPELPADTALMFAALQSAGVSEEVIVSAVDNQRWVMLLNELGIPPASHAGIRQGIEQLGADVDLTLLEELVQHEIPLDLYDVHVALKQNGVTEVLKRQEIAEKFAGLNVDDTCDTKAHVTQFFALLQKYDVDPLLLGDDFSRHVDAFSSSAQNLETALAKAKEWGDTSFTLSLIDVMALSGDERISSLLILLDVLVPMAQVLFSEEGQRVSLMKAIHALLPKVATAARTISEQLSTDDARVQELEDVLADLSLHIGAVVRGNFEVATATQAGLYLRLLDRKIKSLGDSIVKLP